MSHSFTPRLGAVLGTASALAALTLSAIVPVAAAHSLGSGPSSVVLSAPAKTGAFKAAPATTVWGGSTGRALAAGKSVPLKLSRPRGVAASATSWLLQVATSDAKKPGTLAIGAAGATPGADAALAYPKGSSSTTILARVSPSRTLQVRASVKVKVQLSVIGAFTGTSTQLPGPGGTAAIAPKVVVDSATGLGGAIPGRGATATVSVLGLGGVPASGVRAVWVSAQTQGKTGSLAFFKSDGGTAAAQVAPIRSAWSTSLVLASVDEGGRIAYRVTKGALKGLRLAVVGWVGEVDETASVNTVAGGIVPVAAKSIAVKGSGKSMNAKVTGGAIPAKAARVWLRATVATKAAAGTLQVGATKAKAAASSAIGTALPARTAASLVISAPVGAGGRIYLAGPAGTKVSAAAIVGYQAASVKKSADKKAPKVTFDAPGGGAEIDLAVTPSVTLTGTVSDATSGVRSVVVSSGAQVLGAAVVDTTLKPARWKLHIGTPPGTSELKALAIDNAGREAKATRTVATKLAPDATVVSPQVEALTDAESALVTAVTPSSVTIAGDVGLDVGEVMVVQPCAAAPDGLLRRVEAIEVVGASSQVTTSMATIEDAILQADVSLVDAPIGAGDLNAGPGGTLAPARLNVEGPQAQNLRRMGDVGGLKSAGKSTTFSVVLAASGSGTDATTGAAYAISGEARVDITLGVEMSLEVKISWPDWRVWKAKLDAFSVLFTQTTTIARSATVNGSISKEGSKEFDSIRVAAFSIGPVPFTVTLDPFLKASFKAEGSASFRAESKNTWTVGPKYSNGGWSLVNDTKREHKDVAKDFGASVSIRGEAGVDLSLKVCDLGGPYVGVTLWGEANGKLDTEKAAVDVKIGIDGRVGAKVEISAFGFTLVDLNWKKDVGSQSWTIYQDEWPLGGGTSSAPGSSSPTTTPSNGAGGGGGSDWGGGGGGGGGDSGGTWGGGGGGSTTW